MLSGSTGADTLAHFADHWRFTTGTSSRAKSCGIQWRAIRDLPGRHSLIIAKRRESVLFRDNDNAFPEHLVHLRTPHCTSYRARDRTQHRRRADRSRGFVRARTPPRNWHSYRSERFGSLVRSLFLSPASYGARARIPHVSTYGRPRGASGRGQGVFYRLHLRAAPTRTRLRIPHRTDDELSFRFSPPFLSLSLSLSLFFFFFFTVAGWR